MKEIIKENERGFLFQNGQYKKMLQPGSHRIFSFMGQSIAKTTAEGQVQVKDTNIKVLEKDPEFAAATAKIEIPDQCIALHFSNNRLAGVLPTGEFYYWNIFTSQTFRLIDISQPEVQDIPAEYFACIPTRYYTKIEVAEGETALLYFDGAFQKTLGSGVRYFWNYRTKVTFQKMDVRVQQVEVPGQEILTADKVSLRLNFTFRYRVTDPVRMAGELKDGGNQIYNTVQLILRRYVGGYKLDELLEQKENVAAFVLEKLKEQQEQLYIEFIEAGIRDVILPGEIRDIMNTVLVAEKTAQANVISRREETASTRSLLNTAKLLDENETLRRLKEMEYLERICDKVGTISLTGSSNLLGQLKDLITN